LPAVSEEVSGERMAYNGQSWFFFPL